MRIDGSIASYSPDRGARSGTAVTPFRDAQREIDARREQPAAPVSPQSSEQAPQARRAEAASARVDSLPARSGELAYQPALSNRAAQAIASYSATAAFAYDAEAQQVLGLDVFA